MVKIRLTRMGKKKSPFYRIVVADVRAPRDGRFIEQLGTYDTRTNPPTIIFDVEKAKEWISKGAQPTDVVAAILGKAENPKTNKATDYSNKISKKAQAKEDLANAPAEEAPAEEAPVAEDAPVEVPTEEVVAEVPVEEAPIEEAPVEETVAEEVPAEEPVNEEIPAEKPAKKAKKETPAEETAE